MQSACRGILRLNARTAAAVSSASRIGGNQRIAAALHTSALAHAHTNAHRVPAASSPMPRPLVLRSEFSTLGGRWADKDKPEKKDNDHDDVQESKGKESSAKEGKDDKDKDKDEDKDKDKDDKDDKEKKDKKEKKEEEEAPPPPPPHGDKSPFAVFYETLQSEFKKSQEWQESTKQLGQSAQQFSESPAVQKARQAYGTTAEAAGKVGEKTAQTLGKTAVAIGKGAAWTWETPVVKAGRAAARATGEGVAAVTKPVRDTKVYKDIKQNVEEVIDDGASSRYGGYVEREERKKQRELRELREMKGGARKAERMEEDPEAGTNVTLHKDAAWKESWREFRDSNKLMQSLFSVKRSYDESENPVISVTRNLADRLFSGLFAENETARVIRKFREMDANFQLEAFLRELREYILPEVLDAYVRGETDVLRAWLSAAQFSVYAALNQQYAANGLRLDGKVLDIRNVDVLSARILEPGEVPVFIVSCRTQEVHVFRDVKTGELRAGMEDKVQQVTYAIGITRVPDEVANPETSGWRLIELQKSARDFI